MRPFSGAAAWIRRRRNTCLPGGKALLLIDSEAGLLSRCELKVLQRAGCKLDGRWFSNFNWAGLIGRHSIRLNFGSII